jgi:hypothetical protein
MYPAFYKWIAWLGLWLLIAANARANVISANNSPAATELPPPLWGVVAMILVLGLWAVVAHARARIRTRRAEVRIALPQRRGDTD